MPSLLGELYLAHIELANSVDSPACMALRRCLPLRPGKDNVDEVLPRRDRCNLFEVVQRHFSAQKKSLGGLYKKNLWCCSPPTNCKPVSHWTSLTITHILVQYTCAIRDGGRQRRQQWRGWWFWILYSSIIKPDGIFCLYIYILPIHAKNVLLFGTPSRTFKCFNL